MKKSTEVALAKPPRVFRSAQAWRALIAAQSRSGLSLEAFCRREGLCAGSMWNWRKRLAAQKPAACAAEPSAATFVELSPSRASPALASGVKLRLELGDGIVLELSRA